MEGSDIVVIDQRVSGTGIQVASEIGGRTPLHACLLYTSYGASYTLQEILTVKSDDVVGRVKTYEAIVKGQNVPQSGVPESFKVLIKELQSLALDVRVLDKEGEEIDLKQNFDDEDMGIPRVVDDEAFSHVAVDSEVDENLTMEDVPEDAGSEIGLEDSGEELFSELADGAEELLDEE